MYSLLFSFAIIFLLTGCMNQSTPSTADTQSGSMSSEEMLSGTIDTGSMQTGSTQTGSLSSGEIDAKADAAIQEILQAIDAMTGDSGQTTNAVPNTDAEIMPPKSE